MFTYFFWKQAKHIQARQDGRDKAWQSVQFSSVAQSCPTLCDSMNRSTPGLPVHHHLPEFTQTHIHRVSDGAIQPFHPLSSPSPPAFNLSQLPLLRCFSHVRLLLTPWTAAYQPPPSMGFSSQEYCSGVPLPSQHQGLFK